MAVNGLAQNPDIKRTYHWLFGEGVLLDFNNGSPTNDTISNFLSYEGTAVMSDTCGNLLFYTNGIDVWNKNHQLMPNGTSLLGGQSYSAAQAALIVPLPENDSLFYIFTVDEAGNNGANGVRYSIVNMNLQGGFGDVTSKNVLLFAPCMEKLIATYHNNGKDYWIVSRELHSPNIYSYLLDNQGIQLPPIVSPIGSSAGINVLGDGYMRFSPNGEKIAAAIHTSGGGDYDTVDVYSFNNSTGMLFNKISLNFGMPGEVYGVCFSPDNLLLYASMFTSFPYSTNIYQFDVSSGNQSLIQASQTLIYSSNDINTWFGTIQNRPDTAQLFVTQAFDTNALASIKSPNQLGVSVNFTLNDFTFLKNIYGGLPNFVDSYFNSTWEQGCTTSVSEMEDKAYYKLYPNPANDFIMIESTKSFTIKLFNINGVLLNSTYAKNNLFKLDLSSYSNGIYLIQIISNNEYYSHKLIINH